MSPLTDRIDALEAAAAPLADGEVAALDPLLDLGTRTWATRRTRPTFVGGAADREALALAAAPRDPAAVAAVLEQSLAVGLNPSSPTHFGWIPGGSVAAAAAGDFVAALANTYAGYRVPSPAAVEIERVLLDWLADVVGLPASTNGDLTPGGSLANAIALHAATPRVTRKRTGARADLAVLPEDLACTVFVSEERHRCIDKALGLIGHGGRVVTLPVDAAGRMRADTLGAAVARDRAQGGRPWLVVASAGTTSTGAIDPLPALADTCRAEGLWLHVDAAVGGFFALDPEGRRRLAGIERADSVVLDPHKGLFLPYGLGAVLVRDGDRLLAAHTVHHAYIREDTASMVDLGALRRDDSPMFRSPELSRPFRALRMWTALQVHGTRAFASAIGHKLALGAYAWERLSALPHVAVGPRPDLSVVAFRVRHDRQDDPARDEGMQEALVTWLRAEAGIFVTSTVFLGQPWLRLAVLCLQTRRADVDAAMDAVARGAALLTQRGAGGAAGGGSPPPGLAPPAPAAQGRPPDAQ